MVIKYNQPQSKITYTAPEHKSFSSPQVVKVLTPSNRKFLESIGHKVKIKFACNNNNKKKKKLPL